MHIKNTVFSAVFTQSCTHFFPPARPARAAPRGRHSKGARDGGAPHAAVGPGLTGTSPPAGKLHTRPGHVWECAVAVGDPELGLAVPFRHAGQGGVVPPCLRPASVPPLIGHTLSQLQCNPDCSLLICTGEPQVWTPAETAVAAVKDALVVLLFWP